MHTLVLNMWTGEERSLPTSGRKAIDAAYPLFGIGAHLS
jgi:hypothetical protein